MSAEAAIQVSGFLPASERARRMHLVRLFLGMTFVLGVLAVADQRQFADQIAVWAVSPNWRLAIRIGWVLVALLMVMLVTTWTPMKGIWQKAINAGLTITKRLGFLRWVIILILGVGYPLLLLGPYGRFVLPFFTRLLIFWLFTCLGAWMAHSIQPSRNPLFVFLGVSLLFGIIYRTAVFSADISTYPFSLGWSEVSRYYYASLFLSERVYGIPVPPSVLHPTRYMIQAVPFLIPGTSLLVHRLWQVVVWIVLTLLVGILLARRLELQTRWPFWLFAMWALLFLFQGPVWYHLLAMVIVIIGGTRTEKPVFTLGVVLIASLWAGISRVNWIPVPAMLAALLFFLERKRSGSGFLGYFTWPAIWFVIGSGAGFASQWVYILVSGNEAGRFGSSFDSPLLWYRLLPSGTYPLGVLPGILLALLPILLLIAYRFFMQHWKVEALRLTAILAIPAVLFAGGLVVSVKIGGGSNLHNLDAFLAALMILGSYTAANKWQLDREPQAGKTPTPGLLFMSIIWMPICFAIGLGKPLRSFDIQQANRAMENITAIVESTAERGGTVLFISQRHLQTLGYVQGVELIPEYETVFLMEMAMSGNEEYLEQFRRDLKNRRFDLIVVDALSTQIQDRDEDFAEENNAWVTEVSFPILESYKVVATFEMPPTQILAPR